MRPQRAVAFLLAALGLAGHVTLPGALAAPTSLAAATARQSTLSNPPGGVTRPASSPTSGSSPPFDPSDPSNSLKPSPTSADPTAPDIPTGVDPAPPATPTNNHDPECAVAGCSGTLCVPAGGADVVYDTCDWTDSDACYSPWATGYVEENKTIIYDYGDVEAVAVDSEMVKPARLARLSRRQAVSGSSGSGSSGATTSPASPPPLFNPVPLAYCAHNATSRNCSWVRTPQLSSCLATFSYPPPPPEPDYTSDNYTCFVQGCHAEICMAQWPGQPVAMFDCMPSTPEADKEYAWTKCFELSDCAKYSMNSTWEVPEPKPVPGGVDPDTPVTSPPSSGGTVSSSSSPARPAVARRGVIIKGCAWDPDARPGLRDCLEKNGWPGPGDMATDTAVPVADAPEDGKAASTSRLMGTTSRLASAVPAAATLTTRREASTALARATTVASSSTASPTPATVNAAQPTAALQATTSRPSSAGRKGGAAAWVGAVALVAGIAAAF
ncbi:hypothetical protein DFJ74DRAFT_652737 [Hyaloraphidium curvatum]|nr:hypothetical protein DFJ74DRAFT_652737 [Hyaloraphidium curvatum]